jgi:DNA-binding IclR family transcriptional regulator
VRTLGYAITHDELRVGAYGLAVPVRNGDGAAVASLAAIVPITRTQGFTDHAHSLTEAAERITKLLAGTADA